MPDHPRLRLLHGDEADVFHELALRCAVRRRRAFVSDQIVEDACAFDSLQFLRHQPDRPPPDQAYAAAALRWQTLGSLRPCLRGISRLIARPH